MEEGSYRKIEVQNWERNVHYNFFKGSEFGQYNICCNIDITNFLGKLKEKEISFYYAMIYASTYCINLIPEFHYRMRGDGVIYFDKINPSFTYMPENSELFKLITVELEEDMVEFIHHAKQTAVAQQGFIEGIKRDDLIYITSIPWISFTQITHTMSKDKTDTVPRVSWGKYFKDGERILMPFSVQVHHSFVDGIHVGKYVECLQKYMDEYK